MSAEAVKTLVQAFILCRLDYCNSLFYASPKVSWAGCSQSRMQLRVWYWALDGTTTSLQCYRSGTGFQFDVEWISGWPPWSTCHCPAWLQPIWTPTVSLSPAKVVVSCVLPHQGHLLWDEHTAIMETSVLQLQVRNCGTAVQLNCDIHKVTLTFNDLNGY